MKKEHRSPFQHRQYMVNDKFEIYYYEDSSFLGVENHIHNYYEFYFFVDGNMSMHINHTPYPLKHGDVILIPPNTPHHLVCHDKNIFYRRFVFWLDADYYKSIVEMSQDYEYIVQSSIKKKQFIYHNDIISFNAIQSKLFRLIEETYSSRFGQETKINLCIYDLLLHLNRMCYELDHNEKIFSNRTLQNNIVSYIESHLNENLTLESIADAFYVSKYHIAHVFKQNFGLSVHQFIIKKRLAMCQNALKGDAHITEIFQQFGFKDYSSFYRAFKKEYGFSPKEYQEIHKQSATNLLQQPSR